MISWLSWWQNEGLKHIPAKGEGPTRAHISQLAYRAGALAALEPTKGCGACLAGCASYKTYVCALCQMKRIRELREGGDAS